MSFVQTNSLEEQPLSDVKLIPAPRAALYLLVGLGISAALVGFLIRGGWSLGFTLAILALEIGMFLYNHLSGCLAPDLQALHPSSRSCHWLAAGLAPAILALAATSFIYADIFLQVLNAPVVLVLLITQFLLLFRSSDRDWDEPGFWIEAGLAGFVRPFVKLPALGPMFSRLRVKNRQPAGDPSRQSSRKTLVLVLLGLLCALPVLLIAGLLMASADAVFAAIFDNLTGFWQKLSLTEQLADVALTLIFFPFIFSILESGRSRWQALHAFQGSAFLNAASGADAHAAAAVKTPDSPAIRHARTLSLNSTLLVSFLTSINLLYLLFSVIQLTYLTGAFQARLPAGMTYAAYARNGFFELAAISALNVGLIILAVKGAERRSTSGVLLRILSMLLVLASAIQWLSAMFRMILYVQTYGLTLLRFFVSAFMVLIAVFFILLVIKEFSRSFPLFKAGAIAALLSLLLLNYINADAWIARHNVQRYMADPSHEIDLKYFQELSADAVPAMLALEDSIATDAQNPLSGQLQLQLQTIREDLKKEDTGRNWQSWNWSKTRNLAFLENDPQK